MGGLGKAIWPFGRAFGHVPIHARAGAEFQGTLGAKTWPILPDFPRAAPRCK